MDSPPDGVVGGERIDQELRGFDLDELLKIRKELVVWTK
jgi:hypothetical protein